MASMGLGDIQREFTFCIADLIRFAYSKGYELTFGEAYRPREMAKIYAKKGIGIVESNHCKRLAVDFNLFKDGEYLISTEDHRPLGEWWETRHYLARWGGRFGDGNHYSFEYEGIK